MTASHGKSAKVYANGYKLSDFLSSVESSMECDTVETTPFNSSGAKQYIAGNQDATLSGEGFYEGTTGGSDYIFSSALGSSEVVWNWYPAGDSTGNYGMGIKTIGTAYNISSPVDGVVSVTVEGQSNISRERILSLKPHGAVAATSGISTSHDNAAATTVGGVGYFQRTDNSTRGITPLIQHSSSTVWTTLVSFTTNTARCGQRVEVAGEVKRHTRASYVISGSTAVSTYIHFALKRNG